MPFGGAGAKIGGATLRVPHLINRRITDHVCWRNWIYGPDLMLISGPDQAWITSDLCDWAQDQHLECALPGRLLLPRGPTANPPAGKYLAVLTGALALVGCVSLWCRDRFLFTL